MEDLTINDLLNTIMHELEQAKPEERSELARRYAITITELEKVRAYYMIYIHGQTE